MLSIPFFPTFSEGCSRPKRGSRWRPRPSWGLDAGVPELPREADRPEEVGKGKRTAAATQLQKNASGMEIPYALPHTASKKENHRLFQHNILKTQCRCEGFLEIPHFSTKIHNDVYLHAGRVFSVAASVNWVKNRSPGKGTRDSTLFCHNLVG